jgi:hypothetical protein
MHFTLLLNKRKPNTSDPSFQDPTHIHVVTGNEIIYTQIASVLMIPARRDCDENANTSIYLSNMPLLYNRKTVA